MEEKSIALLKEKSKDVRVLSFLSYGHLRKGNWESFTDIFDGLSQLAQKDYESLFPARPRAKQMAFKWLAEQRYADTLNEKKPTEVSYEHIQRLVEALTKLKAVLEQQFPEGSPFPSGLLSFAVKWEKAIKPKPQADPAARDATPAASGGTAAPSAAATSAAGSQETAQAPMENPKDAQTNARKVAMFLIEKEPEKPMGYRLIRSLRWDLVEKPPPVENGKTRLEAPNAERKTFLQNLVAKSDWKKALFEAEKTFSSGPTHYWLDLQRISATACGELGGTYTSVHNAICMETALFLKRVPEISDFSYSDGSPFCDSATKDWIDSDVSAILSSSGSAVSKSSGAESDEFKEEKKEVNKLVSAGKVDSAIEILQNKIQESGSERTNFKRSLILCNILISAKHGEVAVAILESLHEKITACHLDKWESDLAEEAWGLLIKAYKMVSGNQPQNIQITIQEKQNSILSKLSCINPKSALKFKT